MIDERPDLDLKLSAGIFRQYYYLKEELVDFCRRNNLQATGSKPELSERIAVFLESGKRTRAEHKTQKTQSAGEIKPNSIYRRKLCLQRKTQSVFQGTGRQKFFVQRGFSKMAKIERRKNLCGCNNRLSSDFAGKKERKRQGRN